MMIENLRLFSQSTTLEDWEKSEETLRQRLEELSLIQESADVYFYLGEGDVRVGVPVTGAKRQLELPYELKDMTVKKVVLETRDLSIFEELMTQLQKTQSLRLKRSLREGLELKLQVLEF